MENWRELAGDGGGGGGCGEKQGAYIPSRLEHLLTAVKQLESYMFSKSQKTPCRAPLLSIPVHATKCSSDIKLLLLENA